MLIVVSELVTNAVRHAGLTSEQRVTLRTTRLRDRVRVEVVDHGRGFDPAEVTRIEPSARGGYGLLLVAKLQRRRGAHTRGAGRCGRRSPPGPRRRLTRIRPAVHGPFMTDFPPDEFRIESESLPERVTLRPVGELDIASADLLTSALQQADRSGPPLVVLDLAGVTFIDSAGVRCVLQAVAASRANADKLRVARECSEPVRRLFELVGALDRLPYVGD